MSRFGSVGRRLFGGGKTARHVTEMLSGTTLAQVITVLATIPLARLYSPADFAFFALAQSIVVVGVSLGALRYDVAIVLPESDLDARSLHRLASRSIMVTSLALALFLLFIRGWIGDRYDNAAFGNWLVLVAITVYIMAQIANIQNWLIRSERFRTIAGNRVTGSSLVVGSQLLLAPLVGGFEGLMLGLFMGQALTLGILRLRTRELKSPLPLDAPKLSVMARRYKKMPLINAPNVVLDAVRNAGINVLIGSIALEGLGQYSLANRAARAPIYLINGAISQVFLRRMAVAPPGELLHLIRRLLVRIGIVTTPLFVLFYLAAPWMFPFLFGQEWQLAGAIAQALVPWLFLNTFTSPLSNVFLITEKQEWLLGFAFVYAVVPISYLFLTTGPLLETVWILSWIMAGLLCCMLMLALSIARKFDRGVFNVH